MKTRLVDGVEVHRGSHLNCEKSDNSDLERS